MGVAKYATHRAARPDPSLRKERLLGMTFKLSHYLASAVSINPTRDRLVESHPSKNERSTTRPGLIESKSPPKQSLDGAPGSQLLWDFDMGDYFSGVGAGHAAPPECCTL
jgi:hypothetical protein